MAVALKAAFAEEEAQHEWPAQVANGDETNLPNYIGNYSKGLPHDDVGEVDRTAYRHMLRALAMESIDELERVPLDSQGGRKFTNPLAGLSFDPVGRDGRAFTLSPAPTFDSAQAAGEMAELYCMALCRDVPFIHFDDNELTATAASRLSQFSDFRGPKAAGQVTPASLFRGFAPRDLVGPYVSQFLLKDVQFGTIRFAQRQDTVEPNRDYMRTFPTWLRVQRGWDRSLPNEARDFQNPRHIRTPRDIAHYVHFDALYEAFLNACLILLDTGVAVDGGNPYAWSRNQIGFGTFGGPHILTLVTEVATRALQTVWYQKWFVHRRLRPEAFGGRVDNHLSGRRRYDRVISEELLRSPILEDVHRRWASYFLPQAFPEGSPTHPSYGAGHATVAGACVTVLKAWFDETAPVANPVQPNVEGSALVPYRGPDADRMTVGGELDKLAGNIAIGRNMAGVHWRSDYTQSIQLGEAVALEILRQQKRFRWESGSFTLTRFDGRTVTV